MKRRGIFYILAFILILFGTRFVTNSNSGKDEMSKRTKISLREIGNQLLLDHQDSTSVILPVKEVKASQFELSFAANLSIAPDSLVVTMKRSLNRNLFPQNYIVEVTQCKDGEVAYSYEMSEDVEKTIIPCIGRTLPESCYTINIRFLNQIHHDTSSWWFIIPITLILLFCIEVLYRNRKSKEIQKKRSPSYTSLGRFQFYPEQNKLIREAKEIALSKKECELLEIFVKNPNQILKREDLMKRVWEDNGVFVGRSLDTYISKLRKKLQDDESIKITNVHGVGYKLEVNH